MRPWWTGLAPALVAAVVLAGCSSSPGTTGEEGEEPAVITDPRDLSYLQGNATPGSHVHDYWGGRDRVQVLQGDGSVWSQCSGDCAKGMGGASQRPPEGIIVPQGTKWVNGTFGFTPHAENTATAYELWIKTAADGDAKPAGEIQPGVPFSFTSTREQNDPPHYVLSLWQFHVVGKNGGDVVFRGDYAWDVEAVRGLPLEPYPPHPDHWGGSSELHLLDGTGGATVMYGMDGGWSCYASGTRCPGAHAMPDGVVVPYDSSRVEVRIGGNHVGLGLWYHGADTWDRKRVEGTVDGTERLFVIPLQGDGDSPYAMQSLWELYVAMDQPTPVQAYSGVYTITATAYRE